MKTLMYSLNGKFRRGRRDEGMEGDEGTSLKETDAKMYRTATFPEGDEDCYSKFSHKHFIRATKWQGQMKYRGITKKIEFESWWSYAELLTALRDTRNLRGQGISLQQQDVSPLNGQCISIGTGIATTIE